MALVAAAALLTVQVLWAVMLWQWFFPEGLHGAVYHPVCVGQFVQARPEHDDSEILLLLAGDADGPLVTHVCVFAFGQFSQGIFAAGQFAVGLVGSVGMFSVGGLFTVGVLAVSPCVVVGAVVYGAYAAVGIFGAGIIGGKHFGFQFRDCGEDNQVGILLSDTTRAALRSWVRDLRAYSFQRVPMAAAEDEGAAAAALLFGSQPRSSFADGNTA